MNIVSFPEVNKIYKGPASMPDCQDLPVFDVEGVKISCWELSPVERLQAIFSNKIWLTIYLDFQPPVGISPHTPFTMEQTDPQPIEVLVDRMIQRKVKQFLARRFEEKDLNSDNHFQNETDMSKFLTEFIEFIFELPKE